MNIIKTSISVKKILIKYPSTRDNDNELILMVWLDQEPDLIKDDYTFMKFGSLFKKGKFKNTESIRRSRQKLMEEIPSLRGKNYKSRQNHQEDVKEQLKDHSQIAGGTP